MAFIPGTSLGSYEIVAPLGAGGMGEVYRARDTRLGREVALKILPAAVACDPNRLARFDREAKIIAALNHPNIVTLYSIEEVGGVRFLTMELVEGERLDKLIVPLGLSPARLLGLAIPLTDALIAAHEKAIVHRDLKPMNVMVTADDRVKVLDFGVAKLLMEEQASTPNSEAPTRDASLTVPGQVVGTFPYMAPEQILGQEIDARTDVFALGIMLYELATGNRPFSGRNSSEICASILRDKPQLVTERRTDFPRDMARAIERCLEKHPAHRFQSAGDFRSELQRIRLDLERAAREPGAARGSLAEDTVSIAVVPFTQLRSGEDDAFLADGLSEEIITDLSRLRDMRVISRGSCFRLRGQSALDAGRALGVQFVLEGSVRRAGQALRINAQLVKMADGMAVWGERFDTVMDDLFAVQERLARSIVANLRASISPAESTRLSERPIRDVAAYECYLRARHEMWQLSPASFGRALTLLEEGLTRIGENVLLLATMGELWLSAHEFGLIPDEQPLLEAEGLAERAARLDRNAPASLFVSGLIHFKRGRMQRAIDTLQQVFMLEPGNADALTWLNAACFISGRVDAAAPLAARLRIMDPLTPMSVAAEGFVDLYAGRLEVAEPKYRRWFERDADNPLAHYCWGLIHCALGRTGEAGVLFQELERRLPNHVLAMLGTFLRHASHGERDAALGALNPTLEIAMRLSTYLAPHLAAGYALLGDRAKAMEWLEVAFANGFAAWRLLESFVLLYPGIQTDPRYRDLLIRMRKRSESIRV